MQLFSEKPNLETAKEILASCLKNCIAEEDFKKPYRELTAKSKVKAYETLCKFFAPLETTFACWSGNFHQSSQALVWTINEEDFSTLIQRAQERLESTWIG